MAEQERPRTEAGLWGISTHESGCTYSAWNQTTVCNCRTDRLINAAIEAARTEGRQQAVRVEVLAKAIDEHVAEECPFDACFGECARPILDRVAGLNASESPPAPYEPESYMGGAKDMLLVERLDASESGQPTERAMTEQERPRMDRGQAVREGVQRAYAAGLAEGRQQAVREIREGVTAHYRKYGGLPLAVVERILDGVAGLNASESPPTGKRHYHGDTLYDRAIECYDVHGDASESPPLCDQIVNNGMGEPTECGRTLPCPFHRWPFGDASEHAPESPPVRGFSADALTLDRIPTRDASESPPPATSPTQPGNTYWRDTPMAQELRRMAGFPESGDASESPSVGYKHENHVAMGVKRSNCPKCGDASESSA